MKKVILAVLFVFVLVGCNSASVPEAIDLVNMQYDLLTQESVHGMSIAAQAPLFAKDDVTIFVKTGGNREGFYVQTGGNYVIKDGIPVLSKEEVEFVSASTLNNIGDLQHYLYPAGLFQSTVYKDKKGYIRRIELDQEDIK